MNKVSFVITVYNKAPFLPGVIDALKNQTGTFEREYVFVNDGSTDNSWDIVKRETHDLDNVILIDQTNQGVTLATNNGVQAASGDYIKLVDSDDILAPFCTELLLNTLKSHGADFIFAISGEYEKESDITFPSPKDPEVIVFDHPLESVIQRGFARVSHCLFKKSLFDQAGGCDDRIFSQDHSLFIRLSAQGNMAQVRHVVCLSPQDEPGRIMNNSAQVAHDSTLALAYYLQDHPELTPKLYQKAQKKITARTWKWAKRTLNTGYISAEFFLYILSRCGVRLPAKQLVSLCHIFHKNNKIRQP